MNTCELISSVHVIHMKIWTALKLSLRSKEQDAPANYSSLHANSRRPHADSPTQSRLFSLRSLFIFPRTEKKRERKQKNGKQRDGETELGTAHNAAAVVYLIWGGGAADYGSLLMRPRPFLSPGVCIYTASRALLFGRRSFFFFSLSVCSLHLSPFNDCSMYAKCNIQFAVEVSRKEVYRSST